MEDNISREKMQAIIDLAVKEIEVKTKNSLFFEHLDMTAEECLDLSTDLFKDMATGFLEKPQTDTIVCGRGIVEMCLILSTAHQMFHAMHNRIMMTKAEIKAEVENVKGF